MLLTILISYAMHFFPGDSCRGDARRVGRALFLSAQQDLDSRSQSRLVLSAQRIRFVIVGIDNEALKPALPTSAARLAVVLILRARHAAHAAHLVNRVEGMPACGKPI